MKTTAIILLCSINAVAIVGLLYFLFVFWDPLMNGGFIIIDNEFVDGKDSVAFAGEIGRLDTISLLVAYLGLFLIVFTIGSIWYSHHDARNAAQAVAEKQAKDYISDEFKDDLSKLLVGNPEAFRTAIRRGLRNDRVLLEEIVKDILEEIGHIPSQRTDESISEAFSTFDEDELAEGGDDGDR